GGARGCAAGRAGVRAGALRVPRRREAAARAARAPNAVGGLGVTPRSARSACRTSTPGPELIQIYNGRRRDPRGAPSAAAEPRRYGSGGVLTAARAGRDLDARAGKPWWRRTSIHNTGATTSTRPRTMPVAVVE